MENFLLKNDDFVLKNGQSFCNSRYLTVASFPEALTDCLYLQRLPQALSRPRCQQRIHHRSEAAELQRTGVLP